jgi:hypothetical protein
MREAALLLLFAHCQQGSHAGALAPPTVHLSRTSPPGVAVGPVSVYNGHTNRRCFSLCSLYHRISTLAFCSARIVST